MPFWSSNKPPSYLRHGQQIPRKKLDGWLRYRLDEHVRTRPKHLQDRAVEHSLLARTPWRHENQFKFPLEDRLVVCYDDRITGHSCLDPTMPIGPTDSQFFIERADLTDAVLVTDPGAKGAMWGDDMMLAHAANDLPVLVLTSRFAVITNPHGNRPDETEPFSNTPPLVPGFTEEDQFVEFAMSLGATRS